MLALVAMAAVAGCGAPAASKTAGTSPSATPAPAILYAIGGAGNYDSGPFSTPGDWEILWTYDCAAVTDGHDWLIVAIYRQTTPGTATLFDEIHPGPAETSGVTLENHADSVAGPTKGTFYLKVVSECVWHLQAKSLT